jgi:hypothetical protein
MMKARPEQLLENVTHLKSKQGTLGVYDLHLWQPPRLPCVVFLSLPTPYSFLIAGEHAPFEFSDGTLPFIYVNCQVK